MTTALFILRALQLGLHIDDLEEIDFGDVFDLMTEHSNDSTEYKLLANQQDFDKF